MSNVVFRTFVFLGTVWALTFTLLTVEKNLSEPNKFQESDYVMTFYVAGHLVATGEAYKLYPVADENSLTESRFNIAAHSLLPHLPTNSIALFMYSPIFGLIFVPLSKLNPNISLLVWQGISIAGLLVSSFFLARKSDVKASDILFVSSLFFPVMATLWAGQVTLLVGVLPLSAGYFLLGRNRYFLAGLAWSFLTLKPQLLPAVALVAFALASKGCFKCLAGLILGIIVLTAANFIFFPINVTMDWLYTLRLSELVFSSAQSGIPRHLLVCLPTNLLSLFPPDIYATAKWIIYSLAAAAWLAGLWQCHRIFKSDLDEFAKISLTLVMGILLLPLVSPRLLYYDLSISIPAGVILLANRWPDSHARSFKRIAIIGWISISAYMLVIMYNLSHVAHPILLQLVLAAIVLKFFRIVNTTSLAAQSNLLTDSP